MEIVKKQKTNDALRRIPESGKPCRAGRCSRREFLRTVTLLGMSFGSGAFLMACDGGTTTSTTAPTETSPGLKVLSVPPGLQSTTLVPPTMASEPVSSYTSYPQFPYYPFYVVVDKDKCIGCEECVGSCPASVLELIDGKAEPVQMEECLGCETCVEVCRFDAITVTET